MSNRFAALGVALLLGGCAAQAHVVEDPEIWGRVDCVRAQENPMAEQEFEQAKAICTGRAQAAGIASTAGMPVGRGIGGAIGSGIAAGITSAAVSSATATSCMGEVGYVKRPQSHHEAACSAVYAHRDQIAAAAAAANSAALKKSRVKPKPIAAAAPAQTAGAVAQAKPGT
jgi:hypothetical protein